MKTDPYYKSCKRRAWAMVALFLVFAVVLIARMVQLQYAEREFLQAQGESRQQRTVAIPAHRGMLTDRHGAPLAISTPVGSIWAEPKRLLEARDQWGDLPKQLNLTARKLEQMLQARQEKEFLYLRRHIMPAEAEYITSKQLPGLHVRMEYRRYYPTGEVAAQLIGGTNIDDQGHEGLELMLDARLRGQPGARRVRQDSHGRIISDLAEIRPPKHGEDIRLSIDRGLQFVAYRALEDAVHEHRAEKGSVVVLDVITGEVLVMAQVPSFNPNADRSASAAVRRNRAITDRYEPGSVVKPFTILAALQSGLYAEDTVIDTTRGSLRIDSYTIRDFRDFGDLDLIGVLVKSSNVAAANIALNLPPEQLWGTFNSVGFGQSLGTHYPGEATGVLREPSTWRHSDRATLGYGYGISVTPLHMAQAFMILGNRGVHNTPTFLADPFLQGTRVLPRDVCDQVLRMLEHVTLPGGTATQARLPGYTMAAKTGTVRKRLTRGGYSSTRHVAMIAGVVPRKHPRLAMLVLIDAPSAGQYFGGQVAAPVFRRVAWEALRLLNVPPDDRGEMRQAQLGDSG